MRCGMRRMPGTPATSASRIAVYAVLCSAIALAPACLTSNSSRCNNDMICPSGMMCSPSGESCVDSELVMACRTGVDGQVCEVAGLPPGKCMAGVCQANRCGDGRVTGIEDCDGAALNSRTCQTLGFYESSGLACRSDCTFDTSACVGRCGDGVKNGMEQCDGTDLAGATCLTLRYHLPKGLACKSDCTFETAACTGGRCGDGVLNGFEQCDGRKFNRTCEELKFFGALSGMSCTQNCLFSARSCTCAGIRCKATTQMCACDKFGCGCVARS